jgi:primosomal protein N' (replication factor Y)
LRGRNEEKVQFMADHVRKELEKFMGTIRDLIVAGPGPAPLAKAESFYRYQIMLRTRAMSRLASLLDPWASQLELPEDIRLTLDVDPVDLM